MADEPAKARACFFIDGFNFYHSLDEKPDFHQYKWLDYAKLATLFVSKRESIESILYFTAYPTWNPRKAETHKRYVSALRTRGVIPVLGKFKRKNRSCPHCSQEIKTHEEKETDVNIAIELFRLAVRDEYDIAYIVTGDTDLVPAIRALKDTFSEKVIRVVFPFGRVHEELRGAADETRKVKLKHLKSSQLEDEIRLSNGIILRRPDSWI